MRQFLFVIAALWFFGMIVSSFGSRASFAEMSDEAEKSGITKVDHSTSSVSAYRDSATTSSSGKLILKREDDGHFYADVKINGSTIRMLVDTGASGIALTVRDAKRARAYSGVDTDEAVGMGAGGAVYGGYTSLDKVKLGKVTAHDVPAVVIEGGSMSLLGQSFLREFRSVRIEDDRMVLVS